MNLVDGHMHMQVVSIDMHGGHPLVIAKADGFAKFVFNGVQDFQRGPLARLKRKDHVIGLFSFDFGVGRLSGQDQDCSVGGVVRAAVGNAVAFDLLAFRGVVRGVQNVVGCSLPARRVDAALGRDHVPNQLGRVR